MALEQRKRAIIFGDFNFDLLKKERSIKEYKRTQLEHGYTVLNKLTTNFCTRETSSSKTILDHVSTNLKERDFHMAIIESALSDQ